MRTRLMLPEVPIGHPREHQWADTGRAWSPRTNAEQYTREMRCRWCGQTWFAGQDDEPRAACPDRPLPGSPLRGSIGESYYVNHLLPDDYGCGASCWDDLMRAIGNGAHDFDGEDFARRVGLPPGEWNWDDVLIAIQEGELTAVGVHRLIHDGLRGVPLARHE